MKTIWAPWRMVYIRHKRQKGCFLCQEPSQRKDEKNLILHQGERAFVMMNKFPYTNGHLMVVPKRHCLEMAQLSDEEGEELFHLLQTSVRALQTSLGPQGFNIGLNLGKVSGAGEEHLHFHVVPRWAGDTNFMPVLTETKVIPESLQETYRKLDSAFRAILSGKGDGKGEKKR